MGSNDTLISCPLIVSFLNEIIELVVDGMNVKNMLSPHEFYCYQLKLLFPFL